jgi:hypothetical protein
MSAKITTKWARRAVVATVVCGALALGSTAAASAATTTSAGPNPAAASHPTCARAPKALTRISKVEAAIWRRLPRLQAAEKKAVAAGHATRATHIETRIHRLQTIETRAGALAKRINAKCPTGAGSTTGS